MSELLTRLYLPAVRKLLLGIVIVAIAVWGAGAFGWATRDGRVSSEIASSQGPHNVRVTLDADPGSFQQERISAYGVFGGLDGRTITLYNVSADGLDELSHIYWVASIDPAEGLD